VAAPAQINTLRATDFPKGLASKSDVDKLFQVLNPFLQQVGSTTAKGTALGQNIDGQLATISVQTPASDWIALTYTAPWVDFNASNAAGYRVDATGTAWLRGLAKSGTAFSQIGAVPATIAPAQTHRTIVTASRSATTFSAQLDVGGAGGQAGQVLLFQAGTAGAGTFDQAGLDCSWPTATGAPGVLSCFPNNVRLKDGKKPAFVIAQARNQRTQQVDVTMSPAWTYLGQGATGNLLRIDNLPGLALATPYTISLFVFF
jgi:hypothetical protein